MTARRHESMGPAVYSVVFYSAQATSAWWTRWLDRSLVHCEVWWHLGDDYWVALRPNHSHVTCDVMHGGPLPGENGISAVASIRCERSITSPMCPFGLKTCVTAVKSVLGVRKAWIVTPRQLHNYLRKRSVLQ